MWDSKTTWEQTCFVRGQRHVLAVVRRMPEEIDKLLTEKLGESRETV